MLILSSPSDYLVSQQATTSEFIVFTNQPTINLKSMFPNNATYIFENNWEELSNSFGITKGLL